MLFARHVRLYNRELFPYQPLFKVSLKGGSLTQASLYLNDKNQRRPNAGLLYLYVSLRGDNTAIGYLSGNC